MQCLNRRPCLAAGRRGTGLALAVLAAACCSGCFGYLMGITDDKVRQLRQVVAELEVRNVVLVQENLALRQRVGVLENAAPQPERPAPAAGSAVEQDGGSEEVPCPD